MAETAWVPEKWTFSIVVVGVIEWRVQHPLWYQKIGILNEEETQAAIPSAILTPFNSEFAAVGFTVKADPGRWQIITTDESKWSRLIDVARRVFDAALSETQIGAFGINVHAHLTGGGAASAIGHVLVDALRLPSDGKTVGQFQFRCDRDDHAITVGFLPLAEEAIVTHNTHHPILITGTNKTFSLGDLLDRTAKNDWRKGMDFARDFALRYNVSSEVK